MLYLQIILAGFGGGLVRGLVGFSKHISASKKAKFNSLYFFSTIAVSGFIGLGVAAVAGGLGATFPGSGELTPALAAVIGYAGGDFLENIYKIIAKKISL